MSNPPSQSKTEVRACGEAKCQAPAPKARRAFISALTQGHRRLRSLRQPPVQPPAISKPCPKTQTSGCPAYSLRGGGGAHQVCEGPRVSQSVSLRPSILQPFCKHRALPPKRLLQRSVTAVAPTFVEKTHSTACPPPVPLSVGGCPKCTPVNPSHLLPVLGEPRHVVHCNVRRLRGVEDGRWGEGRGSHDQEAVDRRRVRVGLGHGRRCGRGVGVSVSHGPSEGPSHVRSQGEKRGAHAGLRNGLVANLWCKSEAGVSEPDSDDDSTF